MLNLLVEYARQKNLEVESGFKPKAAKWAIQLTPAGQFVGVTPIGDPKRGMMFSVCPEMQGMNSGGKAHPFLEACRVVTLLEESDSDGTLIAPDKGIKEKHIYFFERLIEVSVVTNIWIPASIALSNQETLQSIRTSLRDSKAKPDENVTFVVNNIFPINLPDWHNWWRDYLSKTSVLGNEQQMICFASGQSTVPKLTHEQVSGLGGVGGKSTGTAFISFNKNAFQSFNLEDSKNGAVSKESVAAYRTALNELIGNAELLSGMKVAYWYQNTIPSDDDPIHNLLAADDYNSAEPKALPEAKKLLARVRVGGEKAQIGDNHFYALVLSGAGGRAMIRDWMQGQFSEIVEASAQWFDDLSITGLSGHLTKSSGMERVITCILPIRTRDQQYDKWIKPIGSLRLPLWKSALNRNYEIPSGILAKLLQNHRDFVMNGEFDKAVTQDVYLSPEDKRSKPQRLSLLYNRMGLIKAYHNRKNRGGYQLKPSLNEDHEEPAYHCGRLMAVLAALQQRALGDVGAGVIQRYYGAASANPGLVLGRLIRLSQHHIGKIAGEGQQGRGLAHWYEMQLAQIHNSLQGRIPKTLDLEKQSYFALGYYQQIAARYEKKSDTPETPVTETGDSETNEESQ